jgi:hypothetical protein
MGDSSINMPRFFFDVSVSGQSVRDDLGLELESEQDARDEAAAILPDIWREAPPTSHPALFTLTVRNEADDVVFSGTVLTECGAIAAGHRTQPGRVRLPRRR